MANVPTETPAPTGNALSDANSAPPAITQAQADALNAVNQSAANTASDCLWPPSGQFSIPIIPGIYTQSIGVPCLITYSEARAAVGAALVVGGVLTIWVGLSWMAVAAVLTPVLRMAGITRPPARDLGPSKAGAPAAEAPAAAEGVALAA
jgi:hypothetical protein